jgi:hypothetical protein
MTFGVYSQKFETLPSMIYDHSNHAVAVSAGNVYVFGGYLHKLGGNSNKSEYFSLKSSAWNSISDLPRSMETVGATTMRDTIYLAGNGSNRLIAFNPLNELYSILSIIEASICESVMKSIFNHEGYVYVVTSAQIYK